MLSSGEQNLIYTAFRAWPKELLNSSYAIGLDKEDHEYEGETTAYSSNILLYNSNLTAHPFLSISTIYHELAHQLHFQKLSKDLDSYLKSLYEASKKDGFNFAREYGLKNYKEDIATMWEAYTTKTMKLLTAARIKTSERPQEPFFISKVEVAAAVFLHVGQDGKLKTFIFEAEDNFVKKAQVDLGIYRLKPDGKLEFVQTIANRDPIVPYLKEYLINGEIVLLPVIPDDITTIPWEYFYFKPNG